MTDRHTVDTITSDALDQLYRERDEARQHAATIAAQRDRLRQRMHDLADRWDNALAPDKPYARALRAEISVAPFDPDGAMSVQEYREHGRILWAFRCWGTDTCDGWLGLGHHTETSALLERERHVAEEHGEQPAPAPAATQATGQVKTSPPFPYPREVAEDEAPMREYLRADRHRFTALPVDPDAERAATERAVKAAADSERATNWITAHSAPREHCGHLMPAWVAERSECTLRPGHQGSHADGRGARWWYDPASGGGQPRTHDSGQYLRTEITALRDDLNGITGARWIADSITTILDKEPS